MVPVVALALDDLDGVGGDAVDQSMPVVEAARPEPSQVTAKLLGPPDSGISVTADVCQQLVESLN
jgi:hypothetical protein